jgi:hypothetical protein
MEAVGGGCKDREGLISRVPLLNRSCLLSHHVLGGYKHMTAVDQQVQAKLSRSPSISSGVLLQLQSGSSVVVRL